ncbi:MAG: DUF805 domain-containing protein [Clostridium sp.]
MELLKDYISKAFDFSGEETGRNYKKMCLLSGVLYIILYYVLSIIQKIAIGRVLLSLFIPVCLGVVVLAFVAATFRRCGCTGRSKWWCAVCVLAGPLSFVILFFVLGRN